MRNFWLLRKPRVCQQINPYGDHYGKWYVIKSSGSTGTDLYLHTDGVWRVTTYNIVNGCYTGYFTTKGEAEHAILLYKMLINKIY
jgi:hypothetical protein